jgi:hypothetical protein
MSDYWKSDYQLRREREEARDRADGFRGSGLLGRLDAEDRAREIDRELRRREERREEERQEEARRERAAAQRRSEEYHRRAREFAEYEERRRVEREAEEEVPAKEEPAP